MKEFGGSMKTPKVSNATVIGASSDIIKDNVQEKLDAAERELGRPLTHDEMSGLLLEISQDIFD